MLRNADPSRPKTSKAKKTKKPDPVFESLGIKQEEENLEKPSLNLLYFIAFPILLTLIIIFFCCSCTISVTTVHTQGSADDVVSSEKTPESQNNPTVQVPATLKLLSPLNG